MEQKPKFSVIIPALNEEKYIKYALVGLAKQTNKDFETIVVDGGSKDKTREIAEKYARVIIDTKKPGAARARNTGAKAANGSYLLFIDADTKPSPNLLSIYEKIFNDKRVVAATGPVAPLEKSDIRMRIGYKIAAVYFIKLMLLFKRPSINGMNFAIRKSTFDKIGGFNEDYITYEDWDLSRRAAALGKIVFSNKAVVYSSTRRVKAWGIYRFAKYHIVNMFRHALHKEPKKDYTLVR